LLAPRGLFPFFRLAANSQNEAAVGCTTAASFVLSERDYVEFLDKSWLLSVEPAKVIAEEVKKERAPWKGARFSISG